MIKYDKALELIGWGRYQIRNMIFVHVITGTMALHVLSTIFLAYPMPYHCVPHVKGLLEKSCNVTWTTNDSTMFIPKKEDDLGLDHCQQYSIDKNKSETLEICLLWDEKNYFENSRKLEVCDEHIFTSDGIVETSISEDFQMICGRSWYNYFLQSIFMVGVFLNGLILGRASDRFGRRNVLLFMTGGTVASGFLLTFANSFALFALLRFVIGFFCFTCPTANVLVSETTCIKKRAMMVQLGGFGYSTGTILLVGVAFFARRWKILEISLSSSYLLCILISWLYDESPRWLAAKGRKKEATEVLKKIAKYNKKFLPNLDTIFQLSEDEKENSEENGHLNEENCDRASEKLEIAKETKNPGMIDAMRTPQLRKITLVLTYAWFAVSCAFYGLTLNVENIGGNVYFNTLMMGLMAIPAYPVAIYLCNKIGRKNVIGYCFILSGLFCMSMYFIPKEIRWLHITMFLMGRVFTLIPFTTLYLLTLELYPTVMRSTALNYGSSLARVGAMVAPGIAMLKLMHPTLPYVTFGFITIAAGILIQLLPETTNASMCDSLAEAERFSLQNPGPLEKLLRCRKGPVLSVENETPIQN